MHAGTGFGRGPSAAELPTDWAGGDGGVRGRGTQSASGTAHATGGGVSQGGGVSTGQVRVLSEDTANGICWWI